MSFWLAWFVAPFWGVVGWVGCLVLFSAFALAFLCQLFVCWVWILFGEFDPGSGRTLAACLTHASRTERPACGYSSGERVSNTWVTCPQLWDNFRKRELIPDVDLVPHGVGLKVFSAGDGPAAYQLVGGVMAYQGDDG